MNDILRHKYLGLEFLRKLNGRCNKIEENLFVLVNFVEKLMESYENLDLNSFFFNYKDNCTLSVSFSFY